MKMKERIMRLLLKPAIWAAEINYANERIEQYNFNCRMKEYERVKREGSPALNTNPSENEDVKNTSFCHIEE